MYADSPGETSMLFCMLDIPKKVIPTLGENHTTYEKRLWNFRMDELMKTERVLEGNLYSLSAVMMSLCDSDINSQAESMCEFPELEKKMDSMGLVKLIKKLIYMEGDLHTRHNKAKAHIKQKRQVQEHIRFKRPVLRNEKSM